jgi:RND family efflux transporter MFP subunit
MLDTSLEAGEKLLPPHNEQSLLEAPAEEKLRAEVEALRKEVEQLRKGEKKHSDKPQRPRSRTLWIVGIALLIVLTGAFFLGWLPHHSQEKELQKEAREEAEALPKMNFVRAEGSGTTDTLILPGTTEALTDAPILARADGYVVSRFVDIGDRVKKGQLMAVIAAPDLDQQVVQARAQLAQAQAGLMQANANLQQGKANEELARVTADRYQKLVVHGAVARQDNDQQQTNFQALVSSVGALQQAEGAAQQNVESSRANLQRLIELQAFEHVTAPFDGVVTLRNVDVGALITTGSTLLFRVAQIDRLRTYIDVPQPNAPGVAVGQVAQLTAPEFGTRQFTGHVTRTAGALDPTTRTLVTEVQVPNPQGTLRPGMYVNVSIQNQRSNPPILVPGDALIVDATGAHVGVLRDVRQVPPEEQQNQAQDKKQNGNQKKQNGGAQKKQAVEGTIHLQQISIGRDYGAATEVLSGLSRGDLVIVNPNDDVHEGTKAQATLTKANLDVGIGTPQQSKMNANSEKLQPEPGAEPQTKPPSKTNKKRGPGY